MDETMAIWGYLVLFGGMMLEGELALLGGALMAHNDTLWLPMVIIVGVVAVQLTDWFHFAIGKLAAIKFLSKRPVTARKVKRISRLIEKYPTLILLGYRFVYGFRTVLPIAIGMSQVSYWRFGICSLISAVVWASFFGIGGYYFGDYLESHVTNFKAHEWEIIGGVIGLVLLIVSIRVLYRQLRFRKLMKWRQAHRIRLRKRKKKEIAPESDRIH